MGVFEDILVKARGAVDALGEKAGQFVDVSKLNIKHAELKADLKKEFESLGKMIYNCEKNHIDSASECSNFISRIDGIYTQIKELKDQIATMKNKIICKSCNTFNSTGASFCSKCGKSLSDADKLDVKDDFADFDEQ